MAESTLSVAYKDIQKEFALAFGYKEIDPAFWDAKEESQFAICLAAGMRQFYYPPSLPRPRGENDADRGYYPQHEWSFLRPVTTLAVSSGTAAYDLPDNCNGIIHGTFSFAAAADSEKIVKAGEDQIRNLQSTSAQSGKPKYFCVRVKTHDATVGTQYEVVFYPTPDASYTLSYRPVLEPNVIDATNKYPVGGMAHAETIVAAVLAAGEEKLDNEMGVRRQKFMECLQASVRLDIEHAGGNEDVWAYDDAPTTLDVDFAYMQRQVGKELGYSVNPAARSHYEIEHTKAVIRDGMRLFYTPPLLPNEGFAHTWSFMLPELTITTVASYNTGTITIASGVVTLTGGTFPSWAASGELTVNGTTYEVDTRDSSTQVTLEDTSVTVASAATYDLGQKTYDLPSDYAALEGPLTYPAGSTAFYPPIQIVDDAFIRRQRQLYSHFTFRPTHAAVTVKDHDATVGTRYQISFWGTPDAVYTLTGRYRVLPTILTNANKFPFGGNQHAQTILSACLACAELEKKGKQGPRYAQFIERLVASVHQDREANGPEYLGVSTDPSMFWRNGAWFGTANAGYTGGVIYLGHENDV